MPESKRIAIPYRVPYADTDQMHVVYYANYLTFFERGRNELMRACGITYRELEAGGFALPVLEAHVRYHAPAAYDDLLEITAWCAEFKGVRLTIRCEVRRDGKLLAEGYTVHAHVDIATLRPARPARAFLAALGFLGDQGAEIGDQRSAIGDQKSEASDRRSEIENQKPEIGA